MADQTNKLESTTVSPDEWSNATFSMPVYTWRCEIFDTGKHGLCYYCNSNEVPNWFWRKMQYLFFGNKWIKL